MQANRTDIRSLSIENLCSTLSKSNFPAYRSKQIKNWARKIDVKSFEQMSNLPKDLVSYLETNFSLNKSKIISHQKSSDNTVKYAIQLYDGLVIESVLIPSKDRLTACVSSQVGCSLDCNFCATSLLKRMRNLEYYEIFDQIMLLNKEANKIFDSSITNIVFMGMGEPLMNYNNVLSSIGKITSKSGLGISPKRIVVSTSGIPKMIKKIADQGVKFKLAVSLHSAIDEKRTSIMPFNDKMNRIELEEALKYWYDKTKKIITYEYVVWEDITDRDEDIAALVKLCKRIPCKVNLIQYNSIDDPRFSKADELWVNNYLNILKENKVSASIRRSRGKDIQAACGQLANKH